MRNLLGPAVAVGALAVTLQAASPAAASSCLAPQADGFAAAATADVVVVARAQVGPATEGGTLITPAAFSVIAYEKGSGPEAVVVATSTSSPAPGVVGEIAEGFAPVAGEEWRLFADRRPDGTLAPLLCGATALIGGSAPAPTVRADRRGAVRLGPSGVTGLPRVGSSLPSVPRSAARRLRIGGDVRAVRVVRCGATVATGRRTGRTWRLRSTANRSDRVVVDTDAGFFALRIR